MLRRRVSLAEMAREFAREFPPRTINETEIWAFLSRLHEAGLVISDAPGQGDELLRRHRQERLRSWSLAWAQMTAIRFRGINPDAALTDVPPSRQLALLVGRRSRSPRLVVLFAASIVVGHFDEVRSPLAGAFRVRRLAESGLAVRGDRRREVSARAGPRAGLQTFWRRSARDGRAAAGVSCRASIPM